MPVTIWCHDCNEVAGRRPNWGTNWLCPTCKTRTQNRIAWDRHLTGADRTDQHHRILTPDEARLDLSGIITETRALLVELIFEEVAA